MHHLHLENDVILKILHAFRIWTGLQFELSPNECFASILVGKEKIIGTSGELIHIIFIMKHCHRPCIKLHCTDQRRLK